MNRFLAALAACLVLFTPALSLAQPATQPYLQPPTGAAVPAKGDASGNTKIVDQFPLPYQTYQEVLYNATMVITPAGSENLAAATWSTAHLYPIKSVRLRVRQHTIGAAGINGPLVVRVRGSYDGVAFTQLRWCIASLDSLVGTDTMQVKIWAQSAGTSPNGEVFKLAYADGSPIPHPYLQFAVVNRGSATDSVLIEVFGRQQ